MTRTHTYAQSSTYIAKLQCNEVYRDSNLRAKNGAAQTTIQAFCRVNRCASTTTKKRLPTDVRRKFNMN